LPLIGVLAAVVTRIVPEAAEKEIPHLTFLDIRLVDSGAMGIQESHDEVIKMGEHAQKMLVWLKDVLKSEEIDDDKVSKIFHREEILDLVQKEVTEFVTHILSGHVSGDVVDQARMQLRMADEYESVGDYIAAILKLYLKKSKAGIKFSDKSWKDITDLQDRIQNYMDMVNDGIRDDRGEVLSKARVQGDAITHEIKESRERHLLRVESKDIGPLASLIYTDMLNAYRRIKDHGLNLAEAVAGEK
jgi:phosphate:Na+ symporter